VKTTPLFNQAGQYEGAVALVDDITIRNQSQTQSHLRAILLDSIGEAVTASTPDGTVVYVNAAAERLFGWRAADVIGRASRDMFPTPAESAEEVARINGLLPAGKRYTGSFKMIRHDGSEFVAQLTTVSAFDEDGGHVGFVGVITDESQREQRERRQQGRERQAETLALLGTRALRLQPDRGRGATTVVTEAVEAARRLLEADRAMVLVTDPGDTHLHVRSWSPKRDEAISVPHGSRSFAGYTALARKVIVVGDAESDGRFESQPTTPGPPAVSAIGAPIFGPEGINGVLVAESFTADHFSDADAHFVQSLANIIGTALVIAPDP
jgi:PAS domain S-box-containing protein